MQIILLLLLQAADDPAKSWLTGFNLLIGLLGLIIGIGSAWIILLAKKKDVVSGIQIQRAEASEALVKTRDVELVDANKKIAECQHKCDKCYEELDDVTAELRGQMAINVDKLMSYWAQMVEKEAYTENLEHQLRVVRARLKDTEK